ncbi:hypothetical protein [Foetidibacter luteolus]|uniref:hypothetical protein n=1 Tax=Foetidibacter luteolus TaxID=2608880 RepID=UPI00129B98E7|nr:hypothetical protein [Foetidibacter luteolus]
MNVIKNKIKAKALKKTDAVIDENVPNYEQHPFFVKKAKSAKALIARVGVPK